MKKILSVVVLVFMLFAVIPFEAVCVKAENNTKNSYSEVVEEIVQTYGVYENAENWNLLGLIYGEFIDFDSDGNDEMLVIYRDPNNKTYSYATVVVYKMTENGCVKIFDEGLYGALGVTDVSYQINLKNVSGKTHLIMNLEAPAVNNGDAEKIVSFTMTNGVAERTVYYGEVLPWWDTFEFNYTKCKIDGKMVSEKEYLNSLNALYENAKWLELLPSDKEFDGYSTYYCTEKSVRAFIEKAKTMKIEKKNVLSGILQERVIKDGIGSDIQCLILTLDSPQNIDAIDMFGETFKAKNISEVQISVKNFDKSMIGSHINVTSYEEAFEGHTAYHIRDIVIEGAIAQITNQNITVTLDGERIIFDQSPIIVNGRTMVPLRAIFEKLGARVEWDGNTQTITAVKDETVVQMSIGKIDMNINGEMITLDVAPQLISNRTLVPVRAVAEAFDCNVKWIEETKTVSITTIKAEEIIKKAKFLYEANEKMGGVEYIASYGEVDAALYSVMNEIDATIAKNDLCLNLVSASTMATIESTKAALGNYNFKKIMKDALKDVVKDVLVDEIVSKIENGVPDINTFILELGQGAYEENSIMIFDFINAHMKFKNNEYTYDDAVAYIVMHHQMMINRSTMKMTVKLLGEDVPESFLESVSMSGDVVAKSVLESTFDDMFGSKEISVSKKIEKEITSAYVTYMKGVSEDFFECMRKIDSPVIDEWADEVENYENSLKNMLSN